MKKIDVIALANTLGILALIICLLYRLGGWIFLRSYEPLGGINIFNVQFFILWITSAVGFWLIGLAGGLIYNNLSK